MSKIPNFAVGDEIITYKMISRLRATCLELSQEPPSHLRDLSEPGDWYIRIAFRDPDLGECWVRADAWCKYLRPDDDNPFRRYRHLTKRIK